MGDEVDNGPKPGMAAVGFSALVEGTVTDFRSTFNDAEGPRTKVTLSNVVVHIGKADVDPRGELVLDFFGGPLPDGTFLFIAGAPRLEHWGRGLFFLAPGRWFDQPVLPGQAFRIVEVGGKQVVVSEIGGGVVGFSDEGWGAMARGVVLSPEERYREDPVALPQTQEQLEQFLEPWQFVGQAKLRVADGSMKLSPEGFNGIPWKEGPWNLSGGAPVKKEEINPDPCPEQIREAQGIACLGGIPDGVAADFTPAAMEACLAGGGEP
jgi:hypothetical protein